MSNSVVFNQLNTWFEYQYLCLHDRLFLFTVNGVVVDEWKFIWTDGEWMTWYCLHTIDNLPKELSLTFATTIARVWKQELYKLAREEFHPTIEDD